MKTKSKKETAEDFLKLSAKGLSREAFALYIGENFKHHNVFFKGDAASLMIAMEENANKFPQKTFEIKRSLQDGDLVAIHSHAILTPNEAGVALMHIFRFENDKIVELWDFGQAVPTEMVNENGMF